MSKNKKGLSKDKLNKVAGGKDGRNSAERVGLTYGGEEFLNDVPCHIDTGKLDTKMYVGNDPKDNNTFHFSSGSSATQQ